jgi:hypothetical protein
LGECDLLNKLYAPADVDDQKLLQSIAKRLTCGDITHINQNDVVVVGDIEDGENIEEKDGLTQNKVSVLSML